MGKNEERRERGSPEEKGIAFRVQIIVNEEQDSERRQKKRKQRRKQKAKMETEGNSGNEGMQKRKRTILGKACPEQRNKTQ